MCVGKIEVIVQETVLKTGWDTVLVALPFIGLLLATLFHVDEIFAAHDRRLSPVRPPCGVDEDGQPLLTDPDGRLWRSRRGRR
ncbi:MAG: hypothetical protein ACRD19_09395 [Terriglobia bacterium]